MEGHDLLTSITIACWPASPKRLLHASYLAGGPASRKIVGGLEIQPELRRRVEGLREQPRSLRRDTPFATHQLVDALNRNAEVLCQCDLRLAEGKQELLEQDLSGMGGNTILGLHAYPLW